MIKIYRSKENNLVVSEITDRMITKAPLDRGQRGLGSVVRSTHQSHVVSIAE